MIYLEDDLPTGPLLIGQVSFKRYLSSEKICFPGLLDGIFWALNKENDQHVTFHFLLTGVAAGFLQYLPVELSWTIILFFLMYPWIFPQGSFTLGKSVLTKKLPPCGQQLFAHWYR